MITSQVAHDIHSPLMAMKVISTNLDELSEDKRMLLITAVRRINDIASSLAYRNFERKYTKKREQPELTSRPVIIADCIEQIIAEKRVQIRPDADVELFADLDYEAYSIFTACSESELRRILSNIINNSLEALQHAGSISVSLKQTNKNLAYLLIKDTGRGIPGDILKNLGKRGITVGKHEGTGLGLSHAKSRLEEWGGHLKIESQVGYGTKVQLAIPTTQPPSWFLKSIPFEHVNEVIMLDDEESIHQVWNHRLNDAFKLPLKINRRHFSSPEDFKLWISGVPAHQGMLFLVDYRYFGTDLRGTDLIQNHQLEAHSILVTNDSDEEQVQIQCKKLSVKLLPKSLVRLVPLSIPTPTTSAK